MSEHNLDYPLQDPPMYGDSDYKNRGGKIFQVSPMEYLSLVPKLDISDEETQENIDELSDMMENGQNIDPPTLYVYGDQVIDHDGRHRAYASIKLGINKMPVLVIDKEGTPIQDFNFKPQVKKGLSEIVKEEVEKFMADRAPVIRRPLYKFYDEELDGAEEEEEVIEENTMVRNYATGLSMDDKHNHIAPTPIRASKESGPGTIDPTIAENTDDTIETLSFFDFDGTLANTMEPEEGVAAYKETTGEEFPHQGYAGWWDNKESLEPFDVKVNPTIKKEYSKKLLEPNSKVVLLTNRKGSLHNQIKGILDKNGIKFDSYDYKGNGNEKTDRIKSYLETYPEVKEINVYDDMQEQLTMFNQMKKELAKSDIQVNVFEVKKK
jgi:hypothetical protein